MQAVNALINITMFLSKFFKISHKLNNYIARFIFKLKFTLKAKWTANEYKILKQI